MNVLFLTSNFIPRADANGICVYNIAKEYIKRGDNVLCIAQMGENTKAYEEIEGIKIYRIKDAWFSRFQKKYSKANAFKRLIFKIVHLLRNLFLIPLYPNVSPKRSKKVYKLADRLVREESIDLVVGAFRPYESIYAVKRLKKKYKEAIKCSSLYLDLIWQKKKSSELGAELNDKMAKKSEKEDFKLLDNVFMPITSKEEAEREFGENPKLKYFDFPLYVKETGEECDISFDEDITNIVYVGSLDMNNRSPKKTLDALMLLKERGSNIRLHLWGNMAGVQDIIEKYTEVCEYHGFIDYKYIPSLLNKADYILNISNKTTYDMVPSKIFQIFSTGKPIINILTNERDVSLPYFEKYQNALTLPEADGCEKMAEEILRFINLPKKQVNADELFLENTPLYVANKINGVIKNDKTNIC